MREVMPIDRFNFIVAQIKEQSNLPTVQALFDGSSEVQIVLSTHDGRTCTCNVPVQVLVEHYYFDWIVETAKQLRRGEI